MSTLLRLVGVTVLVISCALAVFTYAALRALAAPLGEGGSLWLFSSALMVLQGLVVFVICYGIANANDELVALRRAIRRT